MPVTSNGMATRVARNLAQLATPESSAERAFLAVVRAELEPEIRKMYVDSADPFGSAWTRDKNGRPAYQSKKMANAIGVRRVGGGLQVSEWVKWIRAADEGHTWPARTATHIRAFTKAGKEIKAFKRGPTATYRDDKGRIVRGRASGPVQVNKRAHVFVDANHKVGARTLPARRQQPGGVMPGKWGEAINTGAEKAMAAFMEKAGAENGTG